MAVVYGVLGLIVILTAGTLRHDQRLAVVQRRHCRALRRARPRDVRRPQIDFSRFSSRFAGRRPAAAASPSRSRWAPSRRCSPARASRRSSFRWCCSRATSMRPARASRSSLPFVLGLGMAIPWPIAGAGIAALPKPGAWMVRVKQAFGVLILATAVYYGYLAYTLFSNRWVDATAVSVERRGEAQGRLALARSTTASPRRAREQKPVLIDLWATWCKNCLTMDKTTFEDPSVRGGVVGLREDQGPGRRSRRPRQPRRSCSASRRSACPPT